MADKPQLVPRVPTGFPKTATLPPPKRFLVQDSPTNPRGGLAFFEYWKEVAGTTDSPKEHADLVTVKFYLHIPVVTYKMVDPTRKNAIFKQIEGPLWFENPEDYETEVPKLLGAARWHVLLNEAGVHGHLMHSYFQAGSWDDYPLVIDLNTLVRTEPKNADYLQWLKKNRVRTPWDNPEDEENEVANDTLNAFANVLERQADTLIKATKEVADVRVEAAREEVERVREETSDRGEKRISAETEGIKLVTEIARENNQSTLAMARDMVGMAREDNKRQDTPMIEILKTAAELFRPQQDTGTAMFIEAMKDQNTKMLEMQNSNQEFMRSVIGMRKNQDGTWASAPQPETQSSAIETELARFQRMADLLGFQKPGAVVQRQQQQQENLPPREPEKTFWGSVAENPVAFITGATTIITLLANLWYNIRAEPGKAVSPQEALQKAAAAQPQPQQQQYQQPQDMKNPASWMTFAQQIHPIFKAHLNGQDSGQNGYTFAEFILSNGTGTGPHPDGRRTYTKIKENLGLQGFDALVKMSPLRTEIEGIPERYQNFLQEFFTYDEMMEEQQRKEGAAAA